MERARRRLQFSLQTMFVLMTLLAAFCYWLTLPSVVASQFADMWEQENLPALNLLMPEIESEKFAPLPESKPAMTKELRTLLDGKYLRIYGPPEAGDPFNSVPDSVDPSPPIPPTQ